MRAKELCEVYRRGNYGSERERTRVRNERLRVEVQNERVYDPLSAVFGFLKQLKT